MSKCVAGSCCYFCLNEQQWMEREREGDGEMAQSTVLKHVCCQMLNPRVLLICQTKHSAAFSIILLSCTVD